MDTPDYNQSLASKATEQAVIRDVWIYTAFLFLLLTVVGLVMTASLGFVALLLFICLTGGLGITWVTHTEFNAARQYGRPPRIHRIFD